MSLKPSRVARGSRADRTPNRGVQSRSPLPTGYRRFAAHAGTRPTPATIPSLQAALAVYRGDFLEGFYVRDAPDFEQWVLRQRADYREAVVNGLHTLATYAEQHAIYPKRSSTPAVCWRWNRGAKKRIAT